MQAESECCTWAKAGCVPTSHVEYVWRSSCESQEQIEELQEEIRRLKGHKGKLPLKPSRMDQEAQGGEEAGKERKRGPQRAKSAQLQTVDEVIAPEGLPAEAREQGWRFKGYADYVVQDLVIEVRNTWADLRRLPTPPRDLRGCVQAALDLYPCDILFVHRDGEREPLERRVAETVAATEGVDGVSVPIVPIRMQEAWLLIDEQALRRASGNPSGKVPLTIPDIERLETIPNPKQLLHDLLREASELGGRRRQKINPHKQALRLGELIEDFAPLRALNAFRKAEADTVAVLCAIRLLR